MEKQLRDWQREALQCYRERHAAGAKSILWEATPGAGKTRAALLLVLHQLRTCSSRVLIVVPTAHLKVQWCRAAAEFKLNIDPNYSGRGNLAPDFSGAVVTYQQIATRPKAFSAFSRSAVAVLDEVHHAGDGLSWGDALSAALREAQFILCLSGTPFRSDSNPIPFVRYNSAGESEPDYSYSYSRAILEGVCRPTAFFAYGGEVAWSVEDAVVEAQFTDKLDKHNSSRRLRAALDSTSGWIDPVLHDAHTMLLKLRASHRQAGGLLVAADRTHARALARLVKGITSESPVVVLSDDDAASKKIKEFSAGTQPWLVACNMVSEGVDIPRLRVGVYATTIRTRMYFRQFLGRIVRQTRTPAGVQVAYCYLPADPQLQSLAQEIESEQRHQLKRGPSDDFFENLAEYRRERLPDDRPSFEAVHAVNSGVNAVILHGNQLSLFGSAVASPQPQALDEVIDREVHSRLEQSVTRSEVKEELAKTIKTLVRSYHHASGKPYAMIHAALNQRQKVQSQAVCTVKQLQERIQLLQRWLNLPSGALSA
jgi:superfamily II DNA or RNA helicase